MIVKMIQDLKNRMKAENEKIQEMFNKEPEDLKNRDQHYKNWKEKYTTGINGKLNEAGEQNWAGRHMVDMLLQSRIKGKKGKQMRRVKETHGTLKAMFTFISLIAQLVKNLPAMQETLVQFLGREDLVEKG